ncbi:baseplate J/gp47 family protein [Nostoc sp. TCL26-01]|uniref:baseplate J/gp47 family protein n=1 Tax=Nostoc sp. TCL26-01 TaxID=2576904 RepID=UPI0015B9D971|nr:baseplate J/gp47 family protein [Nostoc sp. TCL26-01]QLE58026.1 baseplate protein J [Nostoc sp. TCL26-01]
MAILPPKIDQRTYEEIVQQTESLVQQFTDWKPAPGNQPDAGRALIRIFGKMVKSVSDRLNQVTEKNFLAFLDLIGGELAPPQPAKVPLTFYLAQGSPTDGLVPAHTQISAPSTESLDAEILFATDRELVVTTTQLQAVYLREPSQDKYSDHTLAAIGHKDTAFLTFVGDRPISHSLYITCPDIFTLPELRAFNLIINTTNNNQFSILPLNWSYWDGNQWQIIPSPKSDKNQFIFTNLPIPTPCEIQGKTEKWLQANLTNITASIPEITNIQASINIKKNNLIPEVCLFNTTPLDLTKDFYPFGVQPEINDTFYIALHDTFIQPNTVITIDIKLSHKPVNTTNLNIRWEMDNGAGWQEISASNQQIRWQEKSSAIQLKEGDIIQAKLEFLNQTNMPAPTTVNRETRYWLRGRITQGYYGQPSKERKYAIYNEVAAVSNSPAEKAINIVGNAADFFSSNDVIRLVWLENNTTEKREEYEIEKVASSTITLKTALSQNAKASGTKIFRRDIITETIAPIYDPPLIQSLKLSYEFTLTEKAIYFAENDFTYTYPDSVNPKSFSPFTPTTDQEPTLYLGFDQSFDNKPVTIYAQVESPLPHELSTDITTQTILTATANTGDKTLQLADITGWQIGDRLEIQAPEQLHNYTIISINNNQVSINPPLQQNYPELHPIIHPTQPHLVWEYSSPWGWRSLGVEDETQAFSQRGLIQFIAPADFSQTAAFGQQLYWLRVRWLAGNFRVKPRLRRLLTNTTWAFQAISLQAEVLGSSNYEAEQVFTANNTPILLGQQLEVEEGQIPTQIASHRLKIIRDNLGEIEEVWVLWQEVADFYGSSGSDRHYILDHQTGEIRFGNGQAGMIPPRGRNNIRLAFYQTGGGKAGNVTAQTISQLKTTIPYIDRVINLEAAAGGTPQETLDRLKQRVPKQLRHRNRAVTHEDIADLAYAASTDVARVKVVTPDLLTADFSPLNEKLWIDPSKANVSFADNLREKLQTINATEAANFEKMMREINRRAGQIKLIILPDSSDRQPTPSLALLAQVETYILVRCTATLDLVVTTPTWQEVTVNATITPISLEDADMVRHTVTQTLEAFLHPLTGGKGEGWQFGRYPQKSDFYAIIQSIPGVDHVNSLEVQLPGTQTNSLLSADSLIFSGNHVVKLAGRKVTGKKAIGNRQ